LTQWPAFSLLDGKIVGKRGFYAVLGPHRDR
jgi:hypothetical protein